MLSPAQLPIEGKTMTLALAITFNAVLMLALLGGLWVVMSRPAQLKSHLSPAVAPVLEPAPVGRSARARRERRPTTALAVARS
jgi:hypothetical protein